MRATFVSSRSNRSSVDENPEEHISRPSRSTAMMRSRRGRKVVKGDDDDDLFVAHPKDIPSFLACMDVSRSAIDAQGLVPVFQ